ncbi:MAG TPA: class I SAM-dependent methyltransferase [Candidatus Kapabacteria bacterium]|nr:class I SAM-dependent methyltransferase [Candidatus Kapabacteria bacterium]
MTNDGDGFEIIPGEHVERDWGWWSDFLQREYYGAPEEMSSWRAAAASIARDTGLAVGTRVLDLGSGCGELTLQLAMRGAETIGVEQSASLVAYCTELAREREVQATFIAADMFAFEPDAPVDLVVSINTSFGYGTDAQNRELIRKIGRWLKPGGIFYCDIISADSAEAFGSWSDMVAGGRFLVDNSYDAERRVMTSHPTWISPDERQIVTAVTPEVIQLYMRAEMEAMMRGAGLEPERLRRAMGRKFDQDEEQMLTTWIARKEIRG